MEEVSIREELNKIHSPPSLQEVLDSYSDIELTDDEMLQAVIDAKIKKKERIRLDKFKKFQEDNRKMKEIKWNFDIIRTYMGARSKKIFKKDFVIDDDNGDFFDLLCYYFIDDENNFVSTAVRLGVKNPSLKKGLLIPGNVGRGKTWMMLLFSRNKKQSFEVVAAKDICNEYLSSKDKSIPEDYLKLFDTQDEDANKWFNTEETFNQRYIGLCIDDLGSEQMKNNYGNKINVIGDVIESRYAKGFTGPFLHGTTNMSAEEIKEFYGDRVASRIREIFNFIELPGSDRRK